jgi:hypothetical protein
VFSAFSFPTNEACPTVCWINISPFWPEEPIEPMAERMIVCAFKFDKQKQERINNLHFVFKRSKFYVLTKICKNPDYWIIICQLTLFD